MDSVKKSNNSQFIIEEQQKIIKKIGERIKALRKAKGHTSAEKLHLNMDWIGCSSGNMSSE